MDAQTALLDLMRRLDNLVRLGTVHSVDHAAARCRVTSGGLTTEWLPWLAARAGATRTWDPPTVGEQCLLLCPSGEPAGGFVVPAVYADARPAPSADPDEHLTLYPDGAVIRYNHASGALVASGVQTATLEAAVRVTIDAPATHITGTLTVDQLLTYGNGITGTGGDNGNHITGTLTHSGGSLSSNGIVLHTHTHPEHDGGSTGGPQ